MDISGIELMEKVEKFSDEELALAESGLNKLLAVVLHEKQKRKQKKKKILLTKLRLSAIIKKKRK